MSEKRSSYMIEKVGIDYPERRSDKRAPVMLSGCLSYGDDGRLADCVVLDISASGAKVIPGHWISCAYQGATLIEPDVPISGNGGTVSTILEGIWGMLVTMTERYGN